MFVSRSAPSLRIDAHEANNGPISLEVMLASASRSGVNVENIMDAHGPSARSAPTVAMATRRYEAESALLDPWELDLGCYVVVAESSRGKGAGASLSLPCFGVVDGRYLPWRRTSGASTLSPDESFAREALARIGSNLTIATATTEWCRVLEIGAPAERLPLRPRQFADDQVVGVLDHVADDLLR
jgi:hypothetical protein